MGLQTDAKPSPCSGHKRERERESAREKKREGPHVGPAPHAPLRSMRPAPSIPSIPHPTPPLSSIEHIIAAYMVYE